MGVHGDSDIKALILRQILDVNGKKDYLGFIPNDQVGCVEEILRFKLKTKPSCVLQSAESPQLHCSS